MSQLHEERLKLLQDIYNGEYSERKIEEGEYNKKRIKGFRDEGLITGDLDSLQLTPTGYKLIASHNSLKASEESLDVSEQSLKSSELLLIATLFLLVVSLTQVFILAVKYSSWLVSGVFLMAAGAVLTTFLILHFFVPNIPI